MNEGPFFQADQISPADSEIEIVSFTVEPYEDHRRFKVNFRLSFFQDPPNASIALFGVEGEEIASVEVVNIYQPDNEVTLHIPKSSARKGDYRAELTLFSLEERKARPDETGEVRLITQNISTSTFTFTLQ
jgi:hypothetical protein